MLVAMSLQQAVSFLSFVFLAGILMVFLSPIPYLRTKAPRLLMYGFGLAALSIVLVLVSALVLGRATSG